MKKFLIYLSLGIFLVSGIYACITMSFMPRTYDGTTQSVSVYDLQQAPESYDTENADGAAAVIVQENLAQTHSVNNVSSVVFDFRGFDTMGEAFILMTAVAGTLVILSGSKREKEEKADEQQH